MLGERFLSTQLALSKIDQNKPRAILMIKVMADELIKVASKVALFGAQFIAT